MSDYKSPDLNMPTAREAAICRDGPSGSYGIGTTADGSDLIDMRQEAGGQLHFLQGFDAATLGVVTSPDGENWCVAYDKDGSAITIAVPTPPSSFPLPTDLFAAHYLKFTANPAPTQPVHITWKS